MSQGYVLPPGLQAPTVEMPFNCNWKEWIRIIFRFSHCLFFILSYKSSVVPRPYNYHQQVLKNGAIYFLKGYMLSIFLVKRTGSAAQSCSLLHFWGVCKWWTFSDPKGQRQCKEVLDHWAENCNPGLAETGPGWLPLICFIMDWKQSWLLPNTQWECIPRKPQQLTRRGVMSCSSASALFILHLPASVILANSYCLSPRLPWNKIHLIQIL